jgi:hypothetical protein
LKSLVRTITGRHQRSAPAGFAMISMTRVRVFGSDSGWMSVVSISAIPS